MVERIISLASKQALGGSTSFLALISFGAQNL